MTDISPEAVERVAKAIADSDGAPWHERSLIQRAEYMDNASAAIAAMPSPTVGEAVQVLLDNYPDGWPSSAKEHFQKGFCFLVLQALNTPQEGGE